MECISFYVVFGSENQARVGFHSVASYSKITPRRFSVKIWFCSGVFHCYERRGEICQYILKFFIQIRKKHDKYRCNYPLSWFIKEAA